MEETKKYIKIGVLSSSRADYGIYIPLLRKIIEMGVFDLRLIVFGMHNLDSFGLTRLQIEQSKLAPIDVVEGMQDGDSVETIVQNYGRLITNFSNYWGANSYDLVISLGDRYEMSAAVQSLIPFQIPIAHLHGGETTLGAIDNIYRHQISMASSLHFTAAKQFSEKLRCFVPDPSKVFTVGALSLDGLMDKDLPQWSNVRDKFNIPDKGFILITVHPETVVFAKNKLYADSLKMALLTLADQYHLVITGTNADTAGSHFTNVYKALKKCRPDDVSLVESFGKENYFAAMKACKILLGNTSSGIIEAASFHKYVVNIGDRQLGRLQSDNIIDVPFDVDAILKAVAQACEMGEFNGQNVYHKPNSAGLIIEHIRSYLSKYEKL